MRVKKEWGVYMHGVEGTEPDMTVEKQSGTQEEIELLDNQNNCALVFERLSKFGFFLYFLFVRPLAFCSFLLPFCRGSHLSSLIVKTPAFQWLSCTLAEL